MSERPTNPLDVGLVAVPVVCAGGLDVRVWVGQAGSAIAAGGPPPLAR